MFNLTRRGEVGRAELLVDDLNADVAAGRGWHGWLWHLRLLEARAEMALARGDHEEALRLGGEARHHSRAKRRVKYEVYAALTIGRALAGLGRKQKALDELRAATVLASGMRSPAVQLTAAATFLDLEPDQETADRASEAVAAILANLSEPTLRERFLASAPAATARRFS